MLVNRVSAYPFYNVRVSMVAGDNGVLVMGLDNRIQVYDADAPDMPLIADLPARRLETDPVVAWRSATDPYLYVNLNTVGGLIQIDTQTDEVRSLALGSELTTRGLDQLRDTPFSRAHQPIGDQSNQFNPLAGLLLGSDYLSRAGYRGSVFSLLDLLILLLDDPSRDPAAGTALLAYQFNEAAGTGVVDAYHPPSINGIALSPDMKTLAFRRQSGEVEIYDIASGALLRLLRPSEPDPQGQHTFAFAGSGHTLVIDFERYNAASGQRTARTEQYTQTFEGYAFDANGHLITFGGSPLASAAPGGRVWRLWDIDTGHLLREASVSVSGDVMAISDDRLRYLTQTINGDGSADLSIIDARAGSTQVIHIPPIPSPAISQIVPSEDWTRFLVAYSSGALAAYDRDGTRLYFDDGTNLPYGAFSYGWRDDRTIAVQSYSILPPAPITGIRYAPSGLPQCVVDALPDSWTQLVPLWEWLVYAKPGSLSQIAQQLCAALTGEGAHNTHAADGTPSIAADAGSVSNLLLTPSPTVEYRSARTPAPISVPGVPTCITARFRGQSAAYAELWRQITANVSDPAQIEQINTMICEGLLSDLGFVQPTPTVNPNGMAVTTPTPLPAAPQTTGGDQGAYNVLTIDVETGLRSFALNVVATPQTPQPDVSGLLNSAFRQQYRMYPNNPILSPDGQSMAAQDSDGYVTIYRLSRPVSDLLSDEANAIATRAAEAPRSIGLAPTATLPPQALGTPMPSLTPTMTMTPLPFTQANISLPQWNQSQMVCPARQLAHLPTLPDGFAPPGALIVSTVERYNSNFIWTLNPRTGKLTGDPALPRCGTVESCSTSPDGRWMLRQTSNMVLVSRPDGSDTVTLYRPEEADVINPSFDWREPHTLLIHYYSILPIVTQDQRLVTATYDPETGARTAGALDPTPVPLGLLPYDTVSRQPYGTLELLAEYFYGGTRYYLRDTRTGQATLFAQGDLTWAWQPAGRFLYYQDYAEGITYIYDTLTYTHMRLGNFPLPQGVWSPDGHMIANWYPIGEDKIDAALMNGDLPARLYIWNSDTGYFYYYCLPELSQIALNGTQIVWSPDSRYLAFTVSGLLPDGDLAPTPTAAISPEAPPPANTPIPLETQYQYRSPRTLILDTVTGYAAIVSTEASAIERWESAP